MSTSIYAESVQCYRGHGLPVTPNCCFPLNYSRKYFQFNLFMSDLGSVDAISVGLLGEADSTVTVTQGVIFKWNKIYLNMQNNYDTQTGLNI